MRLGGAMASTESNKALLQKIYAGYAASNGTDYESLLAALSDDVVWESLGPDQHMPFAENRKGKEAVRAYFEGLRGDWDQARYDVFAFVAEGDWVVTIGEISVTSRHSGRVFEGKKVDTWRFNEAGEIVEFCEYFDTLGAVLAATPDDVEVPPKPSSEF